MPAQFAAGLFTINGGTIDTTTAADITLSTNNPQNWASSFTFTGTKNLNLGTGAVTLNGSPTVTVSAGVLTVGGAIGDGTGNSFSKSGTGVLLLSGASSFTGSVNVLQGTLRVQSASVNASPLGSTLAAAGNTVTINSGTTLDLTGPTQNTLSFGQKQFFIAGTGVGGVGAILNDGTATTPGLGQQNAFQKVTLTADATINAAGDSTATGAPGRIDFRANQVAGANVAVLDLAGFTLTKAGTSYFGIVNTDVTPGNIVVNGGIFQIETGSNVPGGAGSGSITYNDGTYASFFTNTGDVSRPMTINGNVNMGTAANTVATIASNITLNGAVIIVPRNGNGTGTLTLTGNITETGGPRTITKSNNGTGVSTLILSGNNSFTGGLVINGGVVQLGSAGALNSTTPNAVTMAGNLTSDALRLAGNSVTIASLNGSSANPVVENANAAAATLTINSSTSDNFSGVLRDGAGGGALSLTKTGTGTQTLSGTNTYTGVTTINGGTLQVGNFGNTGSIATTSSVTGTSSGTLSFTHSDDLTFAVPLTGGVKLAQTGSGALTLSGTSTSTGGTDINGGALFVTGALASSAAVNVHGSAALGGNGDGITTGKVGNVVMDAGSIIRPGTTIADNNIGQLTMNSLTVNGGDFAMGISGFANHDLVTVAGTANFAASGSSSFTPFFNTVPQAGSYTLLTAGNLIIDPTHTITLNPPSSTTRFTFNLVKTTGVNGTIALSVGGSNKSIVWTGAQSSVWDVGATSPQNWKELPSTVERYFDLDNVTFDDTSNVSTHNVQLNTIVTPSSVTVAANTDYSILGTGSITGATGLTKSGTGKLTLSNGANDFSGPTNIQDGTLVIGAFGTFSPNSALTLGDGTTSGTLDLGSSGATLASLSSSGTGTANAIGSSSVGQFLTLTISGGDSTFVGAIQDNIGAGSGNSVALTVSGGTLRIDGNNSYTGATTINTGATLRIGNGGATGSLSAATTISNSGTLDFDRSGTLTVSQSISGAGGLEKHGTGTLVLTGSNSYGTTLIDAGKLQIDNGGTTGSLGSGAVTDNGTLTFNRGDDPSAPVTVSNLISGTGDVEKVGTSLLVLSGANTYSGTTTVSNGVLRVTASASFGAIPGGPVVVNSGATVDIGNATANNQNFGQKEFRIQGPGVVLNGEALGALSASGTVTQNNAFQRVVLTGDASIGNPGIPNGAQQV